jgi:hypothetical protein
MKKLLILTLTAALLAIAGCEKYDDSALWDKVNDQSERIAALEDRVDGLNDNITALQGLVNALQNNRYISDVSPLPTSDPGGWIISFSSGAPITIYNGTKGDAGDPGATPQIGVKQDEDGIYYWTLNGDWLLNDEGGVIPVTGPKGDPGANGITPQLRIDNGYWEVSYDNGSSWTSTGVAATGSPGTPGTTPQLRIYNGYWEVSYDNGSSWTSLGVAATGDPGTPGITPQLRINNGYWEVSYDNGSSWTSTGVAATGDPGSDGITPQMRIYNSFWEVSYDNGSTWEPLGVPATGNPGVPGADGITPKLRISSDGYWQVCISGTCDVLSSGTEWENVLNSAGQPVSALGTPGESEAIFAAENGVDTSHPDYVVFTLAAGGTITLPKYKEINIAFTPPAGLFSPNETRNVPFTLTGNVQYVKTLDVPRKWTITTTKTADAGTFTITAPGTFTSGNASGEVIILISDGAERTVMRTMPLSGANPDTKTLLVSETTITASAAADTYSFNITSNTVWTVTSSEPSWCTVSPENGSNNSAVTVTTTANAGAERAATITVSGTGVADKTITVTQAAAAPAYTLAVSPETLNFAATGEDKTFDITSNTAWTVTSSESSWCTVSPENGSNNSAVTVTTTANAGAERAATITVSGTGVADKTITVTQAGSSTGPNFPKVEWDFATNAAATLSSMAATTGQGTLTVSNSSGTFTHATANGGCVYASGWSTDAAWNMEIPVSGFTGGTIKLSFKVYGSATGPRDFAIEWSADKSTWSIGEPTYTISATTVGSANEINEVINPSGLSDKLYIRLRVTSNTSINDGSIGTTGTSRLIPKLTIEQQ